MPEIDAGYAELDDDSRSRLGAALGVPDEDIRSASGELLGRRRRYANGVMLWRQSTDTAWTVYGAIYLRYQAVNEVRGELGWPLSHELSWEPRGRFSRFERGEIYWNGGDAYIVFPSPPPRPTTPAQDGSWEVATWTSGVVGVHAALASNPPRVLFFTFLPPADDRATPAPQRFATAMISDLSSGRLDPGGPADLENVFCSGHALDATGRLIVVGGEREHPGLRTEPVRSIYAVDMARTGGKGGDAVRWHRVGETRLPRWYPTCATLHDGGVIALGGMSATIPGWQPNDTFEVIPPALGPRLTPEYPLVLSGPTGFVDILRSAASYPLVHVLPNRKLFVHAGRITAFIDTATWQVDPPRLYTLDAGTRTYPNSGTSVLLPLRPTSDPPYRAVVMLIGGGRPGGIAAPANDTCEVLDMSAEPLSWRQAATMHSPRVMPDAVLLPDGTVFVTNGSRSGHADAGAAPNFDPEIYDPVLDEWRGCTSATVPRLYHATALLLPDGRVLTAGTDASWNPPPFNRGELRVELFSPPYLFRGPRPVIVGAPENAPYATAIEVLTPDAGTIDEVALVRCTSVTHGVNTDQRWVGLRIEDRSSERMQVLGPPDGHVAPPGQYLLFALAAGVPSVGRFITVGQPVTERSVSVNAGTSSTLLTLPMLGRIVLAASDPATSFRLRFEHGAAGPVQLREDVTTLAGQTPRLERWVGVGEVHDLALDNSGPGVTVVWRFTSQEQQGARARIEMNIRVAPWNENLIHATARELPFTK